MRWLFRVAVVVAVYGGDWAVYRLRGAPQSKVTVNRYVAIPEKGRKTEYDYLGTLDAPCSVSLFSQGGESPCWQLRKQRYRTWRIQGAQIVVLCLAVFAGRREPVLATASKFEPWLNNRVVSDGERFRWIGL